MNWPYPIVCSCSNPDCIANGCSLTRKLFDNQDINVHPPVKPNVTMPIRYLTEEDVRRIIREELIKFIEQLKG
jgi:predicted component of type VI protein secretion system